MPTDITLSDTYFVVAHFHYTIVGGTIFGLFAGTYYWFPKITGRMYNERLGRLHFWWFTLAFNATFLPMFWLGIEGMRRRVADYPAELGTVNLWVSFAAFNIACRSRSSSSTWSDRGARPAGGANPWRAQTLEWQIASPPPIENFDTIPTVTARRTSTVEPVAPCRLRGADSMTAARGHRLTTTKTRRPRGATCCSASSSRSCRR